MLNHMRLRKLTTRITGIVAAAAMAGMAVFAAVDEAPLARADVPGDCLVVDNETGAFQHVTLNYPYISGSWDITPGERSILLADGTPVISSDGYWDVGSSPYYSGTWTYDPYANTTWGCNGSAVLTWYS
ncbi:hypothetical protein [Nocardia sp. CDC160]|uniref:hypothetical protein n=1 Tax=Nocardia sp. CDC160 TaxID=3112166 RepID=UPI002DBB42CE|nr:hypothetical protein [Nocardia sp. CDC160]MEC3920009.1 hypothetical protein [Nocardia sp. CDC160]